MDQRTLQRGKIESKVRAAWKQHLPFGSRKMPLNELMAGPFDNTTLLELLQSFKTGDHQILERFFHGYLGGPLQPATGISGTERARAETQKSEEILGVGSFSGRFKIQILALSQPSPARKSECKPMGHDAIGA